MTGTSTPFVMDRKRWIESINQRIVTNLSYKESLSNTEKALIQNLTSMSLHRYMLRTGLIIPYLSSVKQAENYSQIILMCYTHVIPLEEHV